MSNRQSTQIGVTFKPVPEPAVRVPGEWILVFGVVCPAVVIGLELDLAYVRRRVLRSDADLLACAGGLARAGEQPAGVAPSAGRTAANHQMARVRQWRGHCDCRLLRAPVSSAAAARAGRHHRRDRVAAAGAARLLRVRAEAARGHPRPGTRPAAHPPLIAGLAAGLALLLALDVPPAATRLGLQWAASSEPSERERGLALLRTLGDDDLLLRLCYGVAGRPTGLLSALVAADGGAWFDPRCGRGRSRRLRRRRARSTIACTACRSTPGRRRSRRASGPASPTSSSTTITAARRSADG